MMTENARFPASGRLRLPLALGVAGLMTMGSAAMAWPVLKGAFVPVAPASGAATAPADPAAVSGFVDMTRAQMTAQPALADADEMPDLVLAHAPNLQLDASILRKPRGNSEEAIAIAPVPTPAADLHEHPSGVEVHLAQAQTVRPAPRPRAVETPVTDADIAVTAPPREAPARVTPVSQPAPAQTEGQDDRTRQRLLNVWMSGAYR